MNEKDSKNDMLFFMGCVPFRLLIAYGLHHIFKYDTNTHAPAIYIFFLAAIGLGLIIADTRRRYFDTEKKGFFGSRTYWYSQVHGLLYLLAAFFAFRGNARWGVWVLVSDVVFGIATRVFLKP